MAHTRLAEKLENHIEDLTAAWISAVRQDARILSDIDLSEAGLRDHIPAVIEEISQLLRSNEYPTIANTREARVHAYVRFRQGYRVRDLVRELSLLRIALLDHISIDLRGQQGGAPVEDFLSAVRLINLYIDEELSYAASVYTEAAKPG